MLTCAIVTADADIHGRVRASLAEGEVDSRLNPKTEQSRLKVMLTACDDKTTKSWKIDKRINNPKNNDAQLIKMKTEAWLL